MHLCSGGAITFQEWSGLIAYYIKIKSIVKNL